MKINIHRILQNAPILSYLNANKIEIILNIYEVELRNNPEIPMMDIIKATARIAGVSTR